MDADDRPIDDADDDAIYDDASGADAAGDEGLRGADDGDIGVDD